MAHLSRIHFAVVPLFVITWACIFAGCSGSDGGDAPVDSPAEEVSIWLPTPGTSWQWQLSGPIDTGLAVSVYDVDLVETPQSVIDSLHQQGKRVICYFSAGTWESYRPDSHNFPEAVKGRPLDDYPDERWLDIREQEMLRPLMTARLDRAAAKRCDAVEPDNVDGYENDTGFPLQAADQLAYNRWIAEEAHKRGLSVGLKNDLSQVPELLPYFDWALNESCFYYDECELLLPFVEAGKAVFGVEYEGSPESFCPRANSMNLDWLRKNVELDAFRIACR